VRRVRPVVSRACVTRPVAAIRAKVGDGGKRVVVGDGLDVKRALPRFTRALVAFGVATCLASAVSAPDALAGNRDEFYIEDVPQGLSSGDGGGETKSSLSRYVRR
jgi:hypothetical protein